MDANIELAEKAKAKNKENKIRKNRVSPFSLVKKSTVKLTAILQLTNQQQIYFSFPIWKVH